MLTVCFHHPKFINSHQMLALVWRGPEVNKLEQVSSDGYLVGGGPVQ